LVEGGFLKALAQVSQRAEDHSAADPHYSILAVFFLDRLPVQQLRIPLTLRMDARTSSFALGRIWFDLCAVVGSQGLMVIPAIRGEERRLIVADLFDLTDECFSLLAAILAHMGGQAQFGVGLQGAPDQGLSDHL